MKSTWELGYITTVLSVLALVATLLGGCRPGNQARERQEETPAPTATIKVSLVPTFTSTPELSPTDTPIPTATVSPSTPIPATPTPHLSTVNRGANIRSGPGINYAVTGGLGSGDRIQLVAQTTDGTWFQMASGQWIYAALVSNPPADLPRSRVAEAPPVPPTATPVPPPATPVHTPTATATPTSHLTPTPVIAGVTPIYSPTPTPTPTPNTATATAMAQATNEAKALADKTATADVYTATAKALEIIATHEAQKSNGDNP